MNNPIIFENAAENMAMMKKIALGLLTNEKSIRSSKTRKMKKALMSNTEN